MSEIKLTEVVGAKFREEIDRLNGLWPDDFMALEYRHFDNADAYWWLAHDGLKLVGFAGMVPFAPFPRVGYLKRAAVLKSHHGRGLQLRMLNERVTRAKASTDWTHLVSECTASNVVSANNFIRAGFRLVSPERPWAENTLYWVKEI